MKTKGGSYTLDLVLIVIGMLLLDALIYLLLELLLDGYSAYYAQSSGSFLNKNIKLKERLVFSAIYVWYIINLIGISILFYRMIAKGRKRSFTTKKVSNKLRT